MLLDMLQIDGLLLRHTHLSRVCAVWHPFRRCSWSALLQHAINLLESKTLGFGDEEVCVDKAQEAEPAPEEEDLGSKIDSTTGCGGHVGSDDSDDLN